MAGLPTRFGSRAQAPRASRDRSLIEREPGAEHARQPAHRAHSERRLSRREEHAASDRRGTEPCRELERAARETDRGPRRVVRPASEHGPLVAGVVGSGERLSVGHGTRLVARRGPPKTRQFARENGANTPSSFAHEQALLARARAFSPRWGRRPGAWVQGAINGSARQWRARTGARAARADGRALHWRADGSTVFLQSAGAIVLPAIEIERHSPGHDGPLGKETSYSTGCSARPITTAPLGSVTSTP